MARKKVGLFIELLDAVAELPWWAGMVAAVVSYLLIHPFAGVEITRASGMADVGPMVQAQFIKTIATIGQYLVPMACLIGALISCLKDIQRDRLFDFGAKAPNNDVLNVPNWKEFEILVGEVFRRKGYAVTETGGGGADGGIDLILSKDGMTILVQCKQWKSRMVGVKPVRELAGVVAAKNAAAGIVVSSGSFTEEAKLFAKKSLITLIDGESLRKLIREIQETGNVEPSVRNAGEVKSPSISCPKCGSEMVIRVAKRGLNAGNQFWGCSDFPRCRGARPI